LPGTMNGLPVGVVIAVAAKADGDEATVPRSPAMMTVTNMSARRVICMPGMEPAAHPTLKDLRVFFA